MDENAILANALEVCVDQHGEPDLELSRPVAEVRAEFAGIVDGMINPEAMFLRRPRLTRL